MAVRTGSQVFQDVDQLSGWIPDIETPYAPRLFPAARSGAATFATIRMTFI